MKAAAAQLLARFPGLPILFTSGYSEYPRLEISQAPASRFLQKPYSPTSLAKAIREILRQSANASVLIGLREERASVCHFEDSETRHGMPQSGGAHLSHTLASTITSNEPPWEYFQVLSTVQRLLKTVCGMCAVRYPIFRRVKTQQNCRNLLLLIGLSGGE